MEPILLDVQQNSAAWYKARLGKFTASQVAKLLTKGRAKDQTFGATALDYIDEVIGDRLLSPSVFNDDARFNEWLDRRNQENRACRWGHDNEPAARRLYESITNNIVQPGGMWLHGDVHSFSVSPDGLIDHDGLIEIKCPYTAKSFVKLSRATDGDSLKAINPDYYWQVQAQLAVTGRKWCDFVVYEPALSYALHIAHIERNEQDIATLVERVKLADELAHEYENPYKF